MSVASFASSELRRPPTSGSRRAGSGRPPSGLDKAGGVSIKDLPVFRTETGLGDPKVVWKAPPTALDADHHLPTFADMLREKDESRRSLAIEGFLDLVELCPADRVLTILPSLVPALKAALNTRDSDITISVLKIVQQLSMTSPAIGAKLTEYYPQLLPHLSIYLLKGNKLQQAKSGHVTTKSGFAVSPSAGGGEVGHHSPDFIDGLWITVVETLEILEISGGPTAYATIKRVVPSYVSCIAAEK